MKKKFAYFLFSLVGLQSAAQHCDDPAGLLSVYYAYSSFNASGLGIEAGFIQEHSPFGFFLGCSYFSLKEKKATEETSNNPNEFPVFYLKAIGRIIRIENKFSAFLVVAPQISFRSQFDFQSGVKLLAPLSERVALQLEPLYGIKRRACQVNLHIVLQL